MTPFTLAVGEARRRCLVLLAEVTEAETRRELQRILGILRWRPTTELVEFREKAGQAGGR
jgi:hypothetical protein